MKVTTSVLLAAAAWLATETVQAVSVCPECVYAYSVVASAEIHALPGSTIDEVTGEPVYTPMEGVVLSKDSGFVPTLASMLIVHMQAPVIDSLWVVSDDDQTASGFVADERFELFVSHDGSTWEDLGTFYNDNATIDISGYVASFGAVNYVKTQAREVDILCQLNPETCTTPVYDNAMEVLAIAGIASAAVPLPATVWLFGSGILGLIAVARRR